MAQVSFDVASTMQNENSQFNNDVEFFTLVNDGDEAIVRFLHDSTASFNIMTVHTVQVGGKWRKVNCIRQPQEPTDVCPLCASGNNISNRFFIHMLVYKKNEQGQMVAKPAVWERSFSYATKLKSLLDEYGPLTNELFKIKRNGAKGSMDTTYDILYCSPKVYDGAQYPLVDNAFGNWTELGTIVMNKDAMAMNTFLATGSFPEVQQTNAQNNAAPAAQPQYVPKSEAAPAYAQPAAPTPTYTAPAQAAPAYVAPTAAPAAAPVAPQATTPIDTPPWMNPASTAPASPGTPPSRYY